ncbi:hypothetical protein PMG11_00020 [Penicillium brasilianum]|uniref:HNH nuclease domain-containing protein n=1 Tax=Penicillium brasilianum TaxID=104259 RepID=A0A0F7TB86_PENBI|nr:hypothetical protein PMG11_00020 [Penicillium brasilianum]
MASEIDDQHIFSEFLDPVRQALIAEFVQLAGGIDLVSRHSLFALWFCDISVLRKAVKPGDNDLRNALRFILKSSQDDHAGIWAGAKRPNPAWRMALPISGPSLPPKARQAPSISPERPTKAPRIESEGGLQAPQDDAPKRGRSQVRSQLPVPSLSGVTRGPSIPGQTPQARASSPPKPSQVPPINPESGLKAPQDHAPPRGRSQVRSRLPIPSLSASTLSKRDIGIRDQALARDGQQCVLTKLTQPTLHVSHILPFKLDKITTKVDPIWDWLGIFWDKEKVKTWQQELLRNADGSMNTEFVANLMTLSVQVHEYWDSAVCAFRPISVNDEQTSLKVAFHWLPLALKSVQRNSPAHLLLHPYPDLPRGFTEGPRPMMMLFHMGSRQVIPSGFIFEITTPDPVKMPLPSFSLLELRWHLSRIAAMQGAAEEEDSDFESDIDSPKVPSRSRSPEKAIVPWLENIPFRSTYRSLSPEKEPSRSRSPAKGSSPLKENMPTRSRTRSLSPEKPQQESPLFETSSLEENY